jgi:hypothetical protein
MRRVDLTSEARSAGATTKVGFAIVLVAVFACGGKTNGAGKPDDGAASCCCNLAEGRELLGEANCTDRGGTCDPVTECESTEDPVDPDGGDPDQY